MPPLRRSSGAQPRSTPPGLTLTSAPDGAVLRQEKAGSAFDRKPETLRKALADFDRALESDPTHEPTLRASGYAWLALAYVENQRGGYTDGSKAQVLPYLRNAVDRFERLLRIGGPSPQMSELVRQIRDQLD